VTAETLLSLFAASVAAFVLAVVSAVAGFGGGVLLLPVFTALFGLRVAVPMLTLTQLASNGSRVWLNRHEVRWPLVGWFALGAMPFAVAGAVLLATAPLSPLKRALGVFLIAVVVWRRRNPHPPRLAAHTFAAVGAASGMGSALLGSVGPLTAPFFLAYGLTRAAYIGTEAASALIMHVTKTVAYAGNGMLTSRIVLYGAALTPATLAGAWVGKAIVGRLNDRVFTALVEAGLLVAGIAYLAGW
jgi:uncharacterized membrane protein YfcA